MNRRQTLKYMIATTLVVAAGFVLPGCPSNNGGQGTGTNGTGSSTDPIRIGILLSQTGTVAEYGQRSLKGVQLATDEINKQGLLGGRKVELDVQDAKSEAKDAVSAYQKLASSDGIKLLVGDVYSTTAMAVAPLANKDQVLMLAPGASNPKFRDMGDYIFRNWTSDEFDGRALSDYAYQKVGVKDCAIIYQQVDYTAGLAQAFKDNFTKIGGKISTYEALSESASEARQVAVKVLNGKPSAVYVCATGKASGIVIKYLREANFKGQIFANLTVDTPEFMKLAGNYADGIIFSTPAFDPADKDPRVQKFAKAFKSRFGDAPDTAAGHSYDAMYIMAEAIKQAGTTDTDKVKTALYGIKNFPGVTGRTTFDSNGDVIKNVFIKKIVGGKSQKLEQFNVS